MQGEMMSQYILTVPDDVVYRARQLAEQSQRPVDRILIEHLRTLPVVLPTLPEDEEAELAALIHLTDDTLWTIAQEQMSSENQERLQLLMDRHLLGLATAERDELAQLVERSERLMLRKSMAAALLAERGYSISPTDLNSRE
ncbi:MAG: hypothetical protein KBF17_05025 [Candidatus Promineofilum sp.]|nr:hypothetical protein [Promineifilum sp.]